MPFVMEGSGLSEGKSNFVLAFDRNFVSTTQQTSKLSERHVVVVVPAFSHLVAEEQLLCPDHAISIYLDQTATVRSLHNTPRDFYLLQIGV